LRRTLAGLDPSARHVLPQGRNGALAVLVRHAKVIATLILVSPVERGHRSRGTRAWLALEPASAR